MELTNPNIELEKANRMLSSSEYLFQGGFYEDSVSRSYYAVYHSAVALLASIGRTARTHDGLRVMIGEHFIRPGKLASHYGRILSRIAADRNDADYNSAMIVSAEDARESLEQARSFVGAIEVLLAQSQDKID